MEEILSRLIIQIPGFILAVVIHESAHAYIADKFGDPTAKNLGRISLNPVPHIDLIGSIVFPIIGVLIGGVMFGWAKPVPVDTRRFKNMRKGIFWVSFAGPLSNIMLAIFTAFLLAFLATQISPDFYLYGPMYQMLIATIQINVVLAVFNLLPWPPLDGAKMVSAFLSFDNMVKYESLARYSIFFFLFLMYSGALRYVIGPALMAVNTIVVGFAGMMG